MNKSIDNLVESLYYSSPENFLNLLESKKNKIPGMFLPQSKNNLLYIVLQRDIKTIDFIFSDPKKRFKSVITKEMATHINKSGYSSLHYAVDKKYEAVTKFLLEIEADPNVRMNTQATPLMIAATRGHFNLIKILLSSKADPHLIDNEKKIALHHAAINNHLLALNYLLLNSPETINKQEGDGYTALHYAVIEDKNGTIVKFLIEKNAGVNIQNEEGNTPFMFAAKHNQIKAAQALLEVKADTSILNKGDCSAMTIAIHYGQRDFLEFLLTSKTVKADLISSLGLNEPFPIHTAVLGNQVGMLKFLLTSYPEMVNLPDPVRGTILQFMIGRAALGFDVRTMTLLLLEHKANPNIHKTGGLTPLMQACIYGLEQTVNLLLTASQIKCDLSLRNCLNGTTAFYWAACNGNVSIGESLLNAGDVSAGEFITSQQLQNNDDSKKQDLTEHDLKIINFYKKNIKTDTVYKYVSIHQKNTFLKGADTPFHTAVFNNHLDFVQLLLKRKAVDPDLVDSKGYSALLHSIKQDNEAMVSTLIANKANFNLYLDKMTPLTYAINWGRSEIVKLLLDAKADHTKTCHTEENFLPLQLILSKLVTPNFNKTFGSHYWNIFKYIVQLGPDMPFNNEGVTALHLCVSKNKTLCVRILLEYSANINAQDTIDQLTPLHRAAKQGYMEMVQLLIQSKADLNLQSSCYRATPLHFAVFQNFFDIVALLVKSKADLNIQTVSGHTAFLLAQEKKHDQIAELLFLSSLGELKDIEVSKIKIKTRGEPYKHKKPLADIGFFTPPPLEKVDFGEYGVYVEIKNDPQKLGIRRLKEHDMNTNWFIMVTDAALNQIMSADTSISDIVLKHLEKPILVQHGHKKHHPSGFKRGKEKLNGKDIYLKLSIKTSELRLFSTQLVKIENKILFILDHFEKLHDRTVANFSLRKKRIVLTSGTDFSIAKM